MFQRDQKEISDYAIEGPDQMARVITFVYLTIQQSITTCEAAMKDVDREGVKSKYLWGFKLGAYEWLHENKNDVYRVARSLYNGYADHAVAEIETLQFFASLPGLGLVKGGFVNQLVFGQTGCMDTHNAIIFELPPRAFRPIQESQPKAQGDYGGRLRSTVRGSRRCRVPLGQLVRICRTTERLQC
jgi:hypothetical protein